MQLSEESFEFPPAGMENEFEMSREEKARKSVSPCGDSPGES